MNRLWLSEKNRQPFFVLPICLKNAAMNPVFSHLARFRVLTVKQKNTTKYPCFTFYKKYSINNFIKTIISIRM